MKKILGLLFVLITGKAVTFCDNSQEISLEPPTKKQHIQKTLDDFGFHPIGTFPIAHLGNMGASPDAIGPLSNSENLEGKSLTEGKTEPATSPLETPFDEPKATATCEVLGDVSTAKEDAELTALEKLKLRGTFSILACKMGMDPNTEDHKTLIILARELKETYEYYQKKGKKFTDFIKSQTEFYFCCGLIACYLRTDELKEDIKLWFEEEVSSKGITEKNGVDLIKKSPGENAYFFLQSVEDNYGVEVL